MLDRELLDAFGQIVDMKLANELGPLRYEIKAIKDEVKAIRDEVKGIRSELKSSRDEIKVVNDKTDTVDKRLRKLEIVQETITNTGIKQTYEQGSQMLERLRMLEDLTEKTTDIQGAVDVLKVLTVKKS